MTSSPDSKRALTAGKLPYPAASASMVESTFPIFSEYASIFASIQRTPSTLHTASLYDLLTCAKLRVSNNVELGEYLGGEHVRQLHGNDFEDGDTAASQK